MGQFVVDHMSKLLVRPLERNHHPVLGQLREPSHPFAQQLDNDVRLHKAVMGIVHDERHPVLKGVVQILLQRCESVLRRPGHELREIRPPLCKIDIEMLRLDV